MSKPDTGSFFGHPAGLQTLFVTEMWERMSYYGMRMLLVLFMTATLQEGGLGLTVASAAAIYGLYTGSVYFMGLPGGWIADRLIGGQKAVWYGAIIIMIGHIILAIPNDTTFFIGLIVVILGTGLLKPNIGAMVGQLYSDEDVRRDSGYAIYYMGINLGSVIGYAVCGYLMENVGWHWAFGAAAVGMALGLIQYKITTPKLQGIGEKPVYPMSDKAQKTSWAIIGIVLAFVTYATFQGLITIVPVTVAQYVAVAFSTIFVIYYAVIYFGSNLTQNEKKKLWALLLICIASACFWSGFEQAGSSMNLFARDYTDRVIGSFEIPTGWFQSANSFFIVLLSPFFAALWINLGKRLVSPSYGIKCAVGLIIMASGFIVMFFAAQYAASGMKVAPYWLVATYFLHTVGELCLSPVALSAVSKLSPKRFAGQMMGVFVLTYSIGNIISGLLAGNYDPNNVAQIPSLYIQISLFSIGIGLIILLIGFKSRFWENLPDDSKASTATTNA
ncbi:peptide MFS transporter [Colwellia hornerae]|uniref:Peptide MFS transporter n=1 Tax=Colwellia hornerae TaxID=89402 RepID=A0A5C6QKK3_9GAMM|nr:peptide MFS transporter [Colwellia hornerae]TWX54073.1 peptide MFS transporter [Colwellia hornerae]TWX60848.1 peptide MFS transporter [Colwellia hornerae]TWX69178.1 peptide MFS transporter [Colwellia hornerae]